MKIIIDAFGGDNAPNAVVDGAYRAAADFNVEIALVGDEAKLNAYIKEKGHANASVSIIHANEVISGEDDPVEAIKKKKDSSMVVGLQALTEDKGDAFVSAGNTGALVTGSTLIVKRIKGIRRAAIALPYPTTKGFALLLDGGANADCSPQFLQQFGIMGSIYVSKLFRIENPRVGLINIGTEDEKGNELSVAANKLLKETELNYVGNIESREIPNGAADVIVCDGFTGNIILKLTEGLAEFLFGNVKKVFVKNMFTKLSALFVKKGFKQFKASLDYTEYGGAPILGLSKPVIKAHGSSDANAFYHAIRQAIAYKNSGIIEEITTSTK